jgi:transposase InsO family protein
MDESARAVLHDRDSGFTGNALQRFFQRLGIKDLQTTTYHPQTNGRVERVNRVINAALTHMVNSKQTDWDTWSSDLEFSLRTVPHTATGRFSMELMYGYTPRLPTDIFTCRPSTLLDLATKEMVSLPLRLRQCRDLALQVSEAYDQHRYSELFRLRHPVNF